MNNQQQMKADSTDRQKHKVFRNIGKFDEGKVRVIINADDYGYCEQRSRGIRQLVRNNCISSISVMVNGPNIQKQVNKLLEECIYKSHGQTHLKNAEHKISIGLHLNLTEFHPLSKKSIKNVNIIGSDGSFIGKNQFYQNVSQLSEQKQQQLLQFCKIEIMAQIQRFLLLFNYRRPSHIDGHNHVHMFPTVAKALAQIAPLYGIYSIRNINPPSMLYNRNQTLNQFNRIFIKNCQISNKILKINEGHFIGPDYLIGLEQMGNNLTIDSVKEQLIKAIQKYGSGRQLCAKNPVIQLMVHPGYAQKSQNIPYPLCPFSASLQRQHQMQMLSCSDFIKCIHKQLCTNGELITYEDLMMAGEQKNQNILIYSKLVMGSGNLTTALRLKKILESYKDASQFGVKVFLMNCLSNNYVEEVRKMKQLIYEMGITMVIGVNLTNTAEIIMDATLNSGSQIGYRIPYMLIIAGTDANVTFKLGQSEYKIQKNSKIVEAVKKSICLISLSQEMKNSVKEYLQEVHKFIYEKEKGNEIFVIPQSIINCSTHKKILKKQLTINKKKYIVFPTSFRQVKAVDHVLEELFQISCQYDLDVLIFGPILSKTYFQYIQQLMLKYSSNYYTQEYTGGRVKYMGCISCQQYIQHYLSSAFALINTSQSEGMCCSILQALAYHIPVVARHNSGNSALLNHSVSPYGLIYESPAEFKSIMDKLVTNQQWYDEIKEKMCKKGYEDLFMNGGKLCYETQKQCYEKILENLYFNKCVSRVGLGVNMNMIMMEGVHGVSSVNLKIFDKLFDDGWMYVEQVIKCAIFKQQDSIRDKNTIKLNLLDLGCGNGIFAIYFFMHLVKQSTMKTIQELISKNIDLPTQNLTIIFDCTFLDYHPSAVSNCLLNLRRLLNITPSKVSLQIGKIDLMQSDMFQSLEKKHIKRFQFILANLPQTPFQNSQSRLDKNGGNDALKYNRILIQQYQQYLCPNQSILVMLYSYMSQPKEFGQIIMDNNSKVAWKSSPETHVIEKRGYEDMQKGLSKFIRQFGIVEGRADIKQGYEWLDNVECQVFYVPAQLRVIKQNI